MSNLDYFIIRLAANVEVIRHQLTGVSPEQARWKPGPDKWSLVEVINHLADEEYDDFRYRLDFVLQSPGQQWPEIDASRPARWAVERSYNTRELHSSLGRYASERSASIEWLKGLSEIDLEANAWIHNSDLSKLVTCLAPGWRMT